MKLTILGASGATGTCLVTQALAAGHSVVAVVRDPARLTVPAQERLEVVTANVMDPAAIAPAIKDADVVITAVGPHGTARSTLRQDSTLAIMRAMRMTGAKRLMVVSGSIVADEGESFYLRYLLKPVVRRTFLRYVTADFAATEADVVASGLEWTIFRPPSLNDKPAKGTYRVAVERNLPRCFSITRSDLAACMLRMLDDPATVGKHVCVAN
jgi:putative NADH-flavin reductase